MNRRDRNAGIPVVEPLVAPRFDIEDEEGYNFLERFGFVVFRDVLTAGEVCGDDHPFEYKWLLCSYHTTLFHIYQVGGRQKLGLGLSRGN